MRFHSAVVRVMSLYRLDTWGCLSSTCSMRLCDAHKPEIEDIRKIKKREDRGCDFIVHSAKDVPARSPVLLQQCYLRVDIRRVTG